MMRQTPEKMIDSQNTILNKLESYLNINDGDRYKQFVHFQNANLSPVQRWFAYREGYSAELVSSFLRELNIKGNVFDPFSGSGTTLLAARQEGLRSFGIDINPISTLVSKVENEIYNQSDILCLYDEIEALKNLSFTSPQEKYTTPFPLADKVFNEDILQVLLYLKDVINVIENQKVRNLIFVAWLSMLISVSNVKKEGNGIKYKNRKRTRDGYIDIDKSEWEASFFPDDKFSFVKEKLTTHLETILNDIMHNYGDIAHKPAIFTGNCLNFDTIFEEELEFTFFSPPYCNCFDYFEIHKVDLWLGGFVNTKEDFMNMRQSAFRSNTNSLRNKAVGHTHHSIEKLISLIDKDSLWNRNIPDVIRGYFDDMSTLLRKLYSRTLTGGYVGIVVGNSAYNGIIIPTDLVIADMARELGFKVENILITRHLTTSSQQIKKLEPLKKYLRESIIILKK